MRLASQIRCLLASYFVLQFGYKLFVVGTMLSLRDRTVLGMVSLLVGSMLTLVEDIHMMVSLLVLVRVLVLVQLRVLVLVLVQLQKVDYMVVLVDSCSKAQ